MKQKELRAPSKQHFYNYTLGQPFEDQALTLKDEDVLNNRREYLPKPLLNRQDYDMVAAGIDWGTYHWITIMGRKSSGSWDVINTFHVPRSQGVGNIEADLQSIMLKLEMYDPDIICCDTGDSGNYVARLQQVFGKGIVYGIHTKSSPKSTGEFKASWNENSGIGSIDKLTQVEKLITHLKMKRIGFYSEVTPDLQLLISHFKNVIVRDEEDDKTQETYKVVTCKGGKNGVQGDHFFYSTMYATLGLEKLMDDRDDTNETAFDYTSIGENFRGTQTDIYRQFGQQKQAPIYHPPTH